MARLFHALVVLGAGISGASCGGKAQESAPDRDASAGAGGMHPGVTLTGGDHGGGQGGQGLQAGGNPGEAGNPIFVIPDASDLADGAGPDLTGGGTYSQWNCPVEAGRCARVSIEGPNLVAEGYVIDQACPVDPRQPHAATDCAADQSFACLIGVWMGQPIAVNCQCAPNTEAGCSIDGCNGFNRPSAVTCLEHTKLCGCALTGILIK
jgi:hypothetical protein